jgi:hypothetical protein
MRDNYLETDQYPYATFSGRVIQLERTGQETYRALTRGSFEVHGVQQDREVQCGARRNGPGLEVRCAFQVTLSDHGIPVPKLMFMKIDEVMELDLDFFLVPAGGGEGR